MVSRLAINVSIRLDNFLWTVYRSTHSDSHALCITVYTGYISAC